MAEAAEKKCPFCGEMVKAEAVKCRFCGEFFETPTGGRLSHSEQARQTPQGHSVAVDTEVIFEGTVSGIALVGSVINTIFWLAVLAFLWFIGNANLESIELKQVATVVTVSIALILVFRLFFKWLNWKNLKFTITNDRIEIQRGILKRRIQNMDMWRVQDLAFNQTLLERIFGHGRIQIMSSDKDTPVISFGPIYQGRSYYDKIKRVQLEADRRRGVVHIEH